MISGLFIFDNLDFLKSAMAAKDSFFLNNGLVHLFAEYKFFYKLNI